MAAEKTDVVQEVKEVVEQIPVVEVDVFGIAIGQIILAIIFIVLIFVFTKPLRESLARSIQAGVGRTSNKVDDHIFRHLSKWKWIYFSIVFSFSGLGIASLSSDEEYRGVLNYYEDQLAYPVPYTK